MGVIVVNVDAIMHFGKTYRDLADVMEHRRRVLDFDASILDRQMVAFGLRLHPYTGEVHGSTVGAVMGDVDTRTHRVANYLGKVSTVLFRHAGDAIGDQHFNWTGALLGSLWSSAGSVFSATWDQLAGRVVDVADEKLLPGALESLRSTGLLGATAGVVVRAGKGALGALQAVEGTLDLLSPQQDLTWFESSVESFGDLLKIGSAVGGLALLVAGAPVSVPLIALGVVGSGTDLVFEHWDAVTGVWDNAIDTIGDPIGDGAYNIITTTEQIWNSTVDVLADGVFNVLSTARTYWNWTVDSWYDSVYDLLTKAKSGTAAASAALGLTASGWSQEVIVGGWAGTAIPTYGTPSATVEGWWSGLSKSERDRLFRGSYRRLGNLEGLPVDVRDQANWRAILQDAANSTEDVSDRTMVERMNTLMAIHEMGGKILYWDPQKNYIAVAWGDLDTAERVVVAVPGTGNNLSKFVTNFGPEGQGLHERLGDSIAVISALTWDAPSSVLANVDIESYEKKILNEGMDNVIRTAAEGDRSVVLLGHSAGCDAVQTYAIEGSASDRIDGYALLAAPDPGEKFLDAIGERPVLIGYHRRDPIKLVAFGRPDNFEDMTEGTLGVGRWGADNVTWVEHDSGLGLQLDHTKYHQNSTYYENFADDIEGLFGPSAGGGAGGGGGEGW